MIENTLHPGELFIQQRKHTPSELTAQIPRYIQQDMPQQHADFYADLSYLPLATLDTQGRPWASLLVTQSDNDPTVGIRISPQNTLDIEAEMNRFDPLLQSLKQRSLSHTIESPLFAGVGIDFSNRRRNKLAGKIQSYDTELENKLRLKLQSNEHLGNCPKYITLRSLAHCNRQAELDISHVDNLRTSISQACKAHIDQTSTVFLATKYTSENTTTHHHPSKMGLNHRGGPPGFVRVYEDVKTQSTEKMVSTYLVLPDYSGNRFYQSLGNIQKDALVGLVFPNFHNGDILYATGQAKNLFDKDAEALMPRTHLITQILITGLVFVKQGLNLRMLSNEKFSPYNPPVRYLREELQALGHSSNIDKHQDTAITASLVNTKKLTENISTFTFQLATPIEAPLPGGFGIFDFSEMLDSGYAHMNEDNPQMVNEDYIRTWTISSAASFDVANNQFKPIDSIQITVKRKPGGLISNFLHDNLISSHAKQQPSLKVQLKGTGFGFSCFDQSSPEKQLSIPSKMLWIAGGVGITPFMSMWDAIRNINESLANQQPALSSDIILIFSGRADDLGVLKHFSANMHLLPDSLSIRLLIFQSSGTPALKNQEMLDALTHDTPNSAVSLVQRRLQKTDFENIDDLIEREVFLCGPESLMTSSLENIKQLCGDQLTIHQESYLF
ncbi:MAG: oxidoreductase [Pseudomonadota bacterium]